MSTLSFESIIKDRDTSVRVTPDGFVHAVDLSAAMTGADRKNAATTLTTMDPDMYPRDNYIERKMPGTGNGRTKLVTFKNAIHLIMVLPGKLAREVRVQFADIIRNHFASGPGSSAIAELARDSIAKDPMPPQSGIQAVQVANENPAQANLKRSVDFDIGSAELETAERKCKVALMLADARNKSSEARNKSAEAHHKEIENQKELLAAYFSICTHAALNDEDKAALKANMMRVIQRDMEPAQVAQQQLQIGGAAINISAVASDMGHHLNTAELKAVGVLLKKAYINKYGENPNKHAQMVAGGQSISVNTYTNKDLDLMQGAITAFIRDKNSQQRINFVPSAVVP